MYFDRNIGKTFCPNAAQCGQVSDEYSVIVTGAVSDPIEISGNDIGLATAAAVAVCPTAPRGTGGSWRVANVAKIRSFTGLVDQQWPDEPIVVGSLRDRS